MSKRKAKRPRRWVGPLFALEALYVTFAAKREFDAAVQAQVAAQLADLARQP